MQQLYTCLYVPDFPVAALLRQERNRRVPPVAVYTGTVPNCFVYAVNQVARAGGVEEGMPLAEAKARFADLKTAPVQQAEKRRDDGDSRGIRPYRLRPASPMAAIGETGDQKQATRNKEMAPGTLGGPLEQSKVETSNPACPFPSRDRERAVQPTRMNIPPKGRACRAPTRTRESGATEGSSSPSGELPCAPGVKDQRKSPAQQVNRSPDQRLAAHSLQLHGSRLTGHECNGTLHFYPRDLEAEKQARQKLLGLALAISPRVEDTAPGLIVLDMAGLPDPHASASDFSLGAEKLGLEANVAVSQNRFVALCAARTQPGLTHVFPGQEAGFLQALPLDVLPLDPKEEETLKRWGIHTVGELARLPENSLVARFGKRGGQLVKLARGQQESVLCPYEPPPALEEKMDFDWQVSELASLSFPLSELLNRLCRKLEAHHLAAEEIRLSLKLADGSWFERAVPLSSPLTDPRVLPALLHLDLAAHPPGEAIEGVKVSAQPTPKRMVQFCLFEPPLPSPEKLAVTLARLSHLVGSGRVGAPVVVDTHRPGAFAVTGFAPVNGRGKKVATGNPAGSSTKSTVAIGNPAGRSGQSKIATGNRTGPSGRSTVATGNPAAPSGQNWELSRPRFQMSEPTGGTGNPACPLPSRDRKGAVQSVDADIPRENAACRAPTGILESDVTVGFSPPSGEKPSPQITTAAAATQARIPAPQTDATPPRLNGSSVQQFNRSPAHDSRFTAHGLRRRPPAFRCFRPPPEAEVFLRGSQPVYVTAAEMQGPVHARAGPWRICGEWWTENGWDYEEWDVEVNGRLYRICCERSTQSWYVAGVYD